MPVRGGHAPGSTNRPRQLSNLVGGGVPPPYKNNPPFPEKRGISLVQKLQKKRSFTTAARPHVQWDVYHRSTNSFSAVNHRCTLPEPSPPASFSTSATVTWL